MIRSILSGKLASEPQQRTSKTTGKPFTSARIKADQDGDQALYAQVLAFGDAADRLAGLHVGDAVAAAGTLKIEIWTPEGKEPRPNLTLLADELLSTRRKPKIQHDNDEGGGDGWQA